MLYKNILIPLDGSKLSESALRYIPEIAPTGARVHLLSVVENQVTAMMSLAPELWAGNHTNELKETEDYLEQVSKSLSNAGYEVTTEARLGAIVGTISEIAKHDFDLVVIASHHRSGLEKFILGSVAESVLSHAKCPVLIV